MNTPVDASPLIKWPGGKTKLVGAIEDAFGMPCTSRTYLEPFLGSGAVFLWRKAQGYVGEAILSDVSPKLIGLHQAVRDMPDDVLVELHHLPTEDDWKATYTQVRDAFNDYVGDGPVQAARFIWLNHACFNGLYRESSAGRFNVAVGDYKTVSLPSAEDVYRVSGLLQGAELRCCRFEETMARAGRGDQVYCDPPYVPLTDGGLTTYTADAFVMRDQRQLAACAVDAAARGASVVLSNHDTEMVRLGLYPASRGFEIVAELEVGRSISRDGAGRAPARELLVAIGRPTEAAVLDALSSEIPDDDEPVLPPRGLDVSQTEAAP